jgi:hypothetical protein
VGEKIFTAPSQGGEDDPEEISKITGKWKEGKGKGKRKNSQYLRCSTIGRMKKKEKIIWWGITPYLSPVVSK